MNELIQILVLDPLSFSRGYSFYGSYIAYSCLLLFLGSLAYLISWCSSLNGQLAAVTNALRRERRRSATQADSHNRITEMFATQSFLKDMWADFADTILDENAELGLPTSQLRATQSAKSYFSFESMIEDHHLVPIFKEVPQVLTGLGIVGTFLGLVTSLPTSTQQEVTASASYVQNVLVGMKGAYISSIWGVLLALCFTVIKKGLFGRVNARLSALALHLDRTYRRVTVEEYLCRTALNTKLQLDELKHLANDLPRKLVENMTGAGIASNLDQAIKVNLSEGFRNVNASIIEFQEFHREFLTSAKALQQTFVKLGLGLGNATNAINAYSTLLDNSGRTLEAGATHIGTASQSWSAAAKDLVDLVQKQAAAGETLREALQASNQNIDKFLEGQRELSSSATDSVRVFMQQYQGFQEAVLSYSNQINSTLSSSLGMFDQELGKGVDSLGISIQNLSEFLTTMESSLSKVRKHIDPSDHKDTAA